MAKQNDIRTLGYVVRRTNYGEADRIINIITPLGKVAVIAKGVRKARSKLAGGVEMFTLADYNIHMGQSRLGVVTSAKMIKYYGGILKDFQRMELAGVILKQIARVAESSDSADYYKIVDQCLGGIDAGWDLKMVEGWFWLNLLRASGEELNLYYDIAGEKLNVEDRYEYDGTQMAFVRQENGEYGANEIKLLRLMSSVDLKMIKRVKVGERYFEKILALVRPAV